MMVIVPLNDWTILCAMEVEVRVMKNEAIPMIIIQGEGGWVGLDVGDSRVEDEGGVDSSGRG
jgi:hypothetical protein